MKGPKLPYKSGKFGRIKISLKNTSQTINEYIIFRFRWAMRIYDRTTSWK